MNLITSRYLIEDDPDSGIVWDLPGRTIRFCALPVKVIMSKDIEFLKTSGNYILFKDYRLADILYIGESDRSGGIQTRVREHTETKKYQWALFIVSSLASQPLGTYRKKIEYSLIRDYNPPLNKDGGNNERLSEVEYYQFKEYYGQIQNFLRQELRILPCPDLKIKCPKMIEDLSLKAGQIIYWKKNTKITGEILDDYTLLFRNKGKTSLCTFEKATIDLCGTSNDICKRWMDENGNTLDMFSKGHFV